MAKFPRLFSRGVTTCIVTVLLIQAAITQAKKNSNRRFVTDVSDVKEMKKELRTHNNVMVLYSSNAKAADSWMDIYSDAAAELKGLATLLFVDCSDAKKLCKKMKVSPSPFALKHYKDGEYHKDYDRQKRQKSLINFMRDPEGDLPWEEEMNAGDVVHLGSTKDFQKLLLKEKKPILTMFYAPWCGHCKRMKPEFAGAATELKGSAVLAGMDVDRPENMATRQAFNITGFPTILYFEKGKRKYDYGGERTKDGIVEWMNDPQPPKEPEKEPEWSDEETDVVHLKDSTFDSYLTGHNSVLVMFYAPWCGHCKKMKPEYVDAAATLKEEGLEGVLAAVDATKERALAERFEVKGFPTVKYFQDGEFAWDFSERTADKIVEHLKDPQEPPPPPPPEPAWSEMESEVDHLTDATFKTFTKKKKHVLVMFYAPWCGHCKKAKPEFMEAAEKFRDENKVSFAAVDCTIDKETCNSFEVSGYPTIKYFNYGKFAQDYASGREEEDFVRFMQNQVDPGSAPAQPPPPPPENFWEELDGGENVHQLDDVSFSHFIGVNPSVLVMFYAPWCGHCKRMKPAYAEAATLAKERNLPGKFAAVDATTSVLTSSRFEIKGFPTIKYFKNGVEDIQYSGGRTTDALLEFMRDPSNMPPPPSAEPAWSDVPSDVHHLTTQTFAGFLQERTHVLVMFYAPWCGHCKAAKPAYMEAAEKLKEMPDRALAAVDCTVEKALCSDYDVTGFPTFNFFSSGRFVERYNGGRMAKDFELYMINLLDELIVQEDAAETDYDSEAAEKLAAEKLASTEQREEL
ncbi:protein disulfide-isomerase A5-like [Diadema antillarum]|uniref:protein disulfide-isomerase A5-like n=1 Tax=Diadema antillarum TaxID=105358 RepID=UPI003A880882